MPGNSKFDDEQERQKLVEAVAKIATYLFDETSEELMFMAVLIDKKDVHHPVMFMGVGKEDMGTAIRRLVKKLEAEVVVIIAEAWAMDAPIEDMSEDELRLLATKYGSVEQYPWKKEVLALDFEFKNGHKEGWHATISKEEDGKRSLGPFEWANGSKVVEVSGHLQGFF